MTQRFNIHDAKTQFSKLVAAVERGESVVICRNGTPVIECVPARQDAPAFDFGALSHLKGGSLDHLDAPTDDETLTSMGL